MATKTEVLDALVRELGRWQNNPGEYTFNTGYGGKGVHSEETCTKSALEEAAGEFKDAVKKLGESYSVRVAASFSGREHNEWSVLVEKWGKVQPVFNFHMRVSG